MATKATPATKRSSRLSGKDELDLKVAKTVNTLVGTIGSMTDQYVTLRNKKKELADEVAKIEAQMKETEGQLIERLEAEGSTKGSGKLGTCSISHSVVFNVNDWQKVEAYVKKTGHMQIFQRRLSVEAVREIVENSGKPIPGTEPFATKKINVRST